LNREGHGVTTSRRRVRGTLWAYDYAIVPPQAGERLDGLRTILGEEHAAARRAARTWTGRVVCEAHATHVLVVSDSPDQGRVVNRLLERWVGRAHAAFSLTLPLALRAGT
jgi:hypothetical protein